MEEWKCFKTVLRTCINYNGIVFGGAVRDTMLHNMHSREFQKKHSMSEYDQVDISPETIGRLVVPKDIDCLISDKDSFKLIEQLTRQYHVKACEVSSIYLKKQNNKNYKHIKMSIFMKEKIYVLVDLIIQHSGDLHMPNMDLDFDVNGLVMTTNGIGLNEYLSYKYNDNATNVIHNADILCEVLDNIRYKKAIMVYMCPMNRYIKMSNYGWNIHFVSRVFNYYIKELYEGDCIICKDKIPEDMCCVNYKKCRCDLRICLKCAITHQDRLDKCPLCTELCYELPNAAHELSILRLKYLPEFP